MHRPLHRIAAALLLGIATAGSAEVPGGGAAPPPQPGHTRALEGYIRFTDQEVGDWVAANARAARAGGWRNYAREASETPAAGKSAVESQPASARTASGTSTEQPAGSGRGKP